ncbi:MAG TPA: ribosome small subunit-dependent GTPase A [Tepidisphaeraceae bacterium]|nr:ribosome small subunit-dependent GTPase A [Tepidisphaeraceae bacterium]
MGRRPRDKPSTEDLLHGSQEQEDAPHRQHFGSRSKDAQQRKMERTAELRATEEQNTPDIQNLPLGQVTQVYSLYYQVHSAIGDRLCVTRKTLSKLSETGIVVGDEVRFRDGRPGEEPVIEQVLPRRTILTRTDSFKNGRQHPIVANAGQMLIVASLAKPAVKWGLVDRMIVAAQSGGLKPMVCLNKTDLVGEDLESAKLVMDYYARLGVVALQTSIPDRAGLNELAAALLNQVTVLAGHSGVGKSSLIEALQPGLDIRIGPISEFTQKGRHTTTGARRYDLTLPATVIDTPGVKHFGLWSVTRENLIEYFPDVQAETAPDWRRESYQRIADSL